MKGTQKRMKSETQVFGKIVKKYKISLDEIDDLNIKYDNAKISLNSYSDFLAGRIDSELNFGTILESTKAYSTIVECLSDYINSLQQFKKLTNQPNTSLDIMSCWINDMEEGEYNPPHTHHNMTGWSTVMFLKIPEFVNNARKPHKFHDGQLGFIGHDNTIEWHEPKVGDFYIFEASHQHCVMPFKTNPPKQIRRSMSFNFSLLKNVQ